MSEYAWIKVYIVKDVFVEVKDTEPKTLDFAEELAYDECICDGSITDTNCYGIINDERLLYKADDIIKIEDYEDVE